MSRQDVKSGIFTSEFLLAVAGLVLGTGSGLGGAWFKLDLLIASGFGLAALSVVSYLMSRSKVKASAHAPAPIAPGGRVI